MEAPLTQFQQVLAWIGFDNQAHRDSLEQELGSLSSMGELTHKDIRDLRSSYASRTAAEGRMYFGMNRTKRLQALTDWVKEDSIESMLSQTLSSTMRSLSWKH
jgi:hypothetical protein